MIQANDIKNRINKTVLKDTPATKALQPQDLKPKVIISEPQKQKQVVIVDSLKSQQHKNKPGVILAENPKYTRIIKKDLPEYSHLVDVPLEPQEEKRVEPPITSNDANIMESLRDDKKKSKAGRPKKG